MRANKSGRQRGADRPGASADGTGEAPGREGLGKRHRPEERRAAMEAFRKSRLTKEALARQWDVSHVTLGAWVRQHAAEGPKGLERVASGSARCRERSPLPSPAREEVVAVQRRFTELFDKRQLFVRRNPTKSERRTLDGITRRLPTLPPLRGIMEEVYHLFDRRCRIETALKRLGQLRQRASRIKSLGRALQKLFSATLEKAFTFLDEDLLPSTTNAVERGNRRHREMQKSVHRVRTQVNLVGRMALDLAREERQRGRGEAIEILHSERADPLVRIPDDRILARTRAHDKKQRSSTRAAWTCARRPRYSLGTCVLCTDLAVDRLDAPS